MQCNFTLKHYADTLALAKEKGYVFSKMKDYPQNIGHEKVIFKRHDVDIQMANALRLAKIEAELGIPATYFLRVHANYNPFSFEYYKVVKKLRELGHEIGLHHEADFAKLYDEDEKEMFWRARQVLELIIGEKIVGVAPHEPTRGTKLVDEKNMHEFELEYEAYSSHFFKDIKYIADSGGRWREGCMCEFIKRETPKLCILTHPLWWFEKSPIENY
jgi:hypothetical protein